VLVALLLVGGQRVMRWWLTLVARRKSEELFMLNLLLVTLGLAWLTELAGLSWRWAPSWPACWCPRPNTSTRWRPTSGPSTTCCWACSSSPSA
jgi:hypothetical protein